MVKFPGLFSWNVAVRVALLLGFAWLAGRFWHPYYGFTRFLQLDEQSAALTVPELRGAPLFTYADGYDGHYYAQLAARPLADDSALQTSVDNLSYRARRILLSWLAWAAGGGDALAAVRAYAWLNVALWFSLAALLWRIFPATGGRETIAWAGILFSAGVLHNVRLALTDLLAVLLITGAVVLAERRRLGRAGVLLGLAGLTRETALLGTVAGIPTERWEWRVLLRRLGWAIACAVPLWLWIQYLAARLGWQEPGLGNLTLPLTGWLWKTAEVGRLWQSEPDRWLAASTLLAHVGLTVQAGWLLVRWRWQDAWWRVGAAFAALMLTLGVAVWEGHPGAATRVLLPMAVAFNIVALRQRAHLGWVLAGNLTVWSGVLALWQVPERPAEISTGRTTGAAYVAAVGDGWHPIERAGGSAWAWSPQGGEIEIRVWPRADETVRVRLELRGIGARPFVVTQDERPLAQGEATLRNQPILVENVRLTNGTARLRVHSPAAPQRESASADARDLGLALSRVSLWPSDRLIGRE